MDTAYGTALLMMPPHHTDDAQRRCTARQWCGQVVPCGYLVLCRRHRCALSHLVLRITDLTPSLGSHLCCASHDTTRRCTCHHMPPQHPSHKTTWCYHIISLPYSIHLRSASLLVFCHASSHAHGTALLPICRAVPCHVISSHLIAVVCCGAM